MSTSLNTIEQFEENVVLFADRVANEFNNVYAHTGQLGSLSTVDKSNLVSAINELDTELGTQSVILSSLDGGNF